VYFKKLNLEVRKMKKVVALGVLTAFMVTGCAETNQPVKYQTEDGRVVYQAGPAGYDAKTKCNKVHERIYENGKLVKDQIKEVCKSERTEGNY